MIIEICTPETLAEWARLRHALWPRATEHEHRLDAAALLDQPSEAIAFLARDDERTAIGFAEAALRRDYVNGCLTSPVAFLEGIYVHPDWRTQGVARRLCHAVEVWAISLHCSELASDADIANTASHRMHEALGFTETERVVYYRKPLSRP